MEEKPGVKRVPLTEIATTGYGTQLSVINYSQPVDGKPAILLSAPNATNGRKNGKIWIGLISETGNSGKDKYSVDWKYCYSVDTPSNGLLLFLSDRASGWRDRAFI